MAFEDVFDGSDGFIITSDDFEIPRSKRRVQYQPNGFLGPVISKSQEPPIFSEKAQRLCTSKIQFSLPDLTLL